MSDSSGSALNGWRTFVLTFRADHAWLKCQRLKCVWIFSNQSPYCRFIAKWVTERIFFLNFNIIWSYDKILVAYCFFDHECWMIALTGCMQFAVCSTYCAPIGCVTVWFRTITRSRQQLRRRRRPTTERKSDLQNDEVTSAASVELVRATALQLAPATPVYDIVACAAVVPASSWGVPEAPEPPTSRSIDSRAFQVSAAQLASVQDTLVYRDQSITKTSSQFLLLSVSPSIHTFVYLSRRRVLSFT